MKREKQDLAEKEYLNPGEAAEFWGIPVVKFRKYVRITGLPFVAFYGGRRLVVRSEFERFLKENPKEKEMLVKCSREETRSTGC